MKDDLRDIIAGAIARNLNGARGDWAEHCADAVLRNLWRRGWRLERRMTAAEAVSHHDNEPQSVSIQWACE